MRVTRRFCNCASRVFFTIAGKSLGLSALNFIIRVAMDGSSKSNVLLQTARQDFSWFYLTGTAREKQLMDMLVLTTSLIVTLKHEAVAANATRADPHETREAAERAFVELREKIRGCETFATLPPVEQRAIERVIFHRGPVEG
jgi:hypothetical protein